MKSLLKYLAEQIVIAFLQDRSSFEYGISAVVKDAIQARVIELETIQIAKLELNPNDIIVLKSKNSLSEKAFAMLTKSLEDIFPDRKHKVIILEEDMDITAIANEVR